MILSAGDKLSPVWVVLKKHAAERLESLRAKLENESLSEVQTASLRGRIAEVRALLALENERPTQ